MALVAALAVGSAGLSTAGCGGDNGKTQSSVERRAEEAGNSFEKGKRELEDNLEQAAEEAGKRLGKTKEEARGSIEEAKKEAEKALNEATRQGK